MLTLSLVNPESLEAIFPLSEAYRQLTAAWSLSAASVENVSDTLRRALLEHLHELRRIWWILTFSLVSDVCHLILFWHVRSTAPNVYSQYFWPSYYYSSNNLTTTNTYQSRQKSKQPSVYYALRRSGSFSHMDTTDHATNTTNGNNHQYHQYHHDDGEPALMHAMNDFMIELNTRLQHAKTDWTARLDDFTARLNREATSSASPTSAPCSNMTTSASNHPLFFHLSPFRVLLQLFAYEDVLNNGKLDAVFDYDDGAALTFFVPQLLSFLLHGAFQSSPQLEGWILEKCRRNVYFAHRCYWFLRAWCLHDVENGAVPPTSGNNDTGLAPFLDEPSSPDDTRISCNSRRSTMGAEDFSQRSSFLPEERQMIARLMLRVKECGEEAARILALGTTAAATIPPVNGSSSNAPPEHHDDQYFVPLERHDSTASDPLKQSVVDVATQLSKSPSSLAGSVELGIVPVRPTDGSPSLRHFYVLSAQRRYGFLPLDLSKHEAEALRPAVHPISETEHFDKAPQFLDALLDMADRLFHVPRQNRKDELRQQLRNLECDLLPSNAIYLPVGNVRHRVWRVVAEESMAISTKERVPCIVCLEVVDTAPPRRRPNAWGFLDRLPRRYQQSNSVDSSIGPAGKPNGFDAPRSASPATLQNATEKDYVSEADMVARWRSAPRNPNRRTSLFDKVKVVKSQVQDHLINQYRDRSRSEEYQSLTLAEALVDQPLGSASFPASGLAATDVEAGNDAPLEAGGVQTGMSRASSGGSLVSMGQWSSPVYEMQKKKRGDEKNRNALAGVRRRVENDFDDSGHGSGALRYGSDHEGEVSTPSKSRRDEETTSRPPPVVFREDWKTKEERLRAKSAYGSHPGWRLLPILLKSNDDLRQEQLASQLIYKMSATLAREKVPVWLYNYEIIALTETGGIIEAIPDTISLDSLKKNDMNSSTLKEFYHSHFTDSDDLADAKANFVESLAAYSIVCFLLQIKDRHNGNILLDNRGHLIHIDFGFFFLSSPGKNAGFESAPFKLTRDFVELLDGPNSHLFRTFRDLCVKTFIALRRHCMELILLVEMLKNGNEELNCFRGRPDYAIQQLRERFRLDLNDRACREYVNSLVDDSIENWRTDWYDRYQRYFVGVL